MRIFGPAGVDPQICVTDALEAEHVLQPVRHN